VDASAQTDRQRSPCIEGGDSDQSPGTENARERSGPGSSAPLSGARDGERADGRAEGRHRLPLWRGLL